MYVRQRKPKQPEKLAKRIFTREFKRYLAEADTSLMIFEEDGEIYYQKLPVGFSKSEYEQLKKMKSRSIIDAYVDLVVKRKAYDWNTVTKLDAFIEDLLKRICRLRIVRFEDGILRKKRRYELFKQLELPVDLRRHLDFYIRESKEAVPRYGIIKETVRAIILSLAEIYEKLSPAPEEGVSKEDYNMLRTIEKSLRKCIESELSKLSTRWWKEKVPPDVRENAEDRKAESEPPWPWYSKEDNPTCYIDFSDYCKIILKMNDYR